MFSKMNDSLAQSMFRVAISFCWPRNGLRCIYNIVRGVANKMRWQKTTIKQFP